MSTVAVIGGGIVLAAAVRGDVGAVLTTAGWALVGVTLLRLLVAGMAPLLPGDDDEPLTVGIAPPAGSSRCRARYVTPAAAVGGEEAAPTPR